MTAPEHKSDFKHTTYIPYLTLTGKLWGVYFENWGENWPRYYGTALYISTMKPECHRPQDYPLLEYCLFDYESAMLDLIIWFWWLYHGNLWVGGKTTISLIFDTTSKSLDEIHLLGIGYLIFKRNKTNHQHWLPLYNCTAFWILFFNRNCVLCFARGMVIQYCCQ